MSRPTNLPHPFQSVAAVAVVTVVVAAAAAVVAVVTAHAVEEYRTGYLAGK